MARIRVLNGSTSWPTPGRSPGQRHESAQRRELVTHISIKAK
jgi:hypothetical protein